MYILDLIHLYLYYIYYAIWYAVKTWDMETPWNDSKAKSLQDSSKTTTQKKNLCDASPTLRQNLLVAEIIAPAPQLLSAPFHVGLSTGGDSPAYPASTVANSLARHRIILESKRHKGMERHKCGVQLWDVFNSKTIIIPSKRFTDSPRSSPNWIHSHLDHGEVVGCKALVEVIFARNLQQIRKWNSNIESYSSSWPQLYYITEWSGSLSLSDCSFTDCWNGLLMLRKAATQAAGLGHYWGWRLSGNQ